MMVRNHPKIVVWPPQPGGTNVTAAYPQAESQAVVKKIHVGSVTSESVPLTCEFKGNEFSYDVLTTDPVFAKKLAAEFAKQIGVTLEQLGNLEIDF